VTQILAPPTGEGEDVTIAATADAHIGEAIVVATITLPDPPIEE
jgi:hypothetical protein